MSYTLTNPTPCNWDHTYSILSGKIQPNEPSPEAFAKFDTIMTDFLREQGVPGASIAINLHGKPVYRQGYGIAGPGTPVTALSTFRVASISKTLTAIGVLRLCEQGRLSLNHRVFARTPPGVLSHLTESINLHKAYNRLTVQHLLEHSAGWNRDAAGIGDHVFWYQEKEHKAFLDPWDDEKLLKYVLSKKPQTKPGAHYAYSNLGYLVLGKVIEAVTGMVYEDFICSLLRDIGVEGPRVGSTKKRPATHDEVDYYNNKEPWVVCSVLEDEGLVVPQYGSFPMENTGAYGGWVAGAGDLVAIIDSLVYDFNCDHPISETMVTMMLSKSKFADVGSWYGLGLDVEEGDCGLGFGHTGAMEGTSSTLFHDGSGLSWSLLLNAWARDMDLNGVVKLALATVSDLPLFHPGLTSAVQGNHSDCLITSSDHRQCVQILLPHDSLTSHLAYMRKRGYRPSYMDSLSRDNAVMFNIVWEKDLLLTQWSVAADLTQEALEGSLQERRQQGFHAALLAAYWWRGNISHIVLYESGPQLDQKVYCVDGKGKHLRLMKYYRKLGL